jgi:hypothetical protein
MIPEKLNVGPSDIIGQHEVKREEFENLIRIRNLKKKTLHRQTINSSITESS